MDRLCEANLNSLPQELVAVPYSRKVSPKVVHLGVGAFHRAHQAWYFHRLNQQQPDNPWLIVGASLRSPTASEALNPQDGLFTHVAQSEAGENISIVGSLTSVIDAANHPQALVAAIAAETTTLITLTITEKGYCLAPGGQQLDGTRTDVAADLSDLDHPRTAIGFLVAGLKARYHTHGQGLTILSCDNLSDNGHITQNAVLAMAKAHSDQLHDWIHGTVSFPCSMVDRIAPAVTDDDLHRVSTTLGMLDQGAVVTEQFSQWVIEDKFAGLRPELPSVGVTFVEQVAAWEQRKLRLLNAAHTALACVGGWLGFSYVHEAMANDAMNALVQRLWQETGATLPVDSTFDLESYLGALRRRFSNPHLAHALAQIATDTSQKLPQRILAPLQELLDQQARYTQQASLPQQDSSPLQAPPIQPNIPSVETLTTVVAAWMCILAGTARDGSAIKFSDPLLGELQAELTRESECYEAQVAVIIKHYPPLQRLCADTHWQQQLIETYARLKQGVL